MNYENDIRIDEDSLDLECLEQPSLMMRYAKHSAEMRMAVDNTKQSLDVVRAELDRNIREKPEDYDIGKVTEAAISSAILTDRKYQKAYDDFLKAKYESDMAQGAIRAVEQRKDMLEALIKLHLGQYFAGPKVPHNLTELRQAKASRVDAGISSRIQRGK
jgi:DNA repair ATPase RecN